MSLQGVQCHCRECSVIAASAVSLQVVQCHCGKSSVIVASAVSLQGVQCHCGKCSVIAANSVIALKGELLHKTFSNSLSTS